MKNGIVGIVGLIIVGILLFFVLRSCKHDIGKITTVFTEYDSIGKSYLNKQVVLRKDTYLIIDYNLWDESFTLDNGSKINWTLADSLKIK